MGARQVQSAISHAKNSGTDAAEYAARVEYGDEKRAAIARVYRLYEERLVNNNALDFDDLMIKAVRLLRKREDVRAHYNERFRYILVDEYQDTNTLQFASSAFSPRNNRTSASSAMRTRVSTNGAARTSRHSDFEQHYPKRKRSVWNRLSFDAEHPRYGGRGREVEHGA